MARLLSIMICLFSLYNAILVKETKKTILLVNDITGIPVANATAHNSSFSFNRISDHNGLFSLGSIPAGEKEIIISCVGFAAKTIIINGAYNEITVRLTPKNKFSSGSAR